jgi:hypothetical protein
VPRTAISYPVRVTGTALTTGTYGALIMLAYGDGQTLRYPTGFTITTRQLRRTFGPHAPELTPERPDPSTAILLAIAGVAGLILGGLITAIARRRAS